MTSAGYLECPDCQGFGYVEAAGHAGGCTATDCCEQCPDYYPESCYRCLGYGEISILEVLANVEA